MPVINITLPYGLIKQIDDYSKIINEILKHEITLNILKFSVGSSGVTLLLDVPEEKIKEITESLQKNDILVNRKGRIKVDTEKCIDCGACVSLCPTDALKMDEELKLEYIQDKCIGCLLCIDSCPRYALEES